MISQSDIIRALVNKNCTDESIMSLALSPDCTLPKLLEKFNEAERFDLALDVSMKLGLDVSPIWKTWAMRCLKNRNFQAAREKFRHCFQRLRSSAERCNPACSNLLCDILSELLTMEDSKLPLNEEIDLIKNGKKYCEANSNITSISLRDPGTISSRPKIYSECLHYLERYGAIEDRVRFFVRTSLWQQAVKLLLENCDRLNADRFFIVEVALKTSTLGQLDDLLAAFIEQDPNSNLAPKYYKAMYYYYDTNKRFNSLYYLQNKLEDFVAAAENLIINFFLRRPMTSYKELNSRITRLADAGDNYRRYINKLRSNGLETGPSKIQEHSSSLFRSATFEEAEDRLKKIDTQISITKNFAINEVIGCINSIEVVCDNSSATGCPLSEDQNDATPVTLFDDDVRRRIFLTALVMIYFDLECTAYFSTSGLNLASELIQEYELDKLSVFKTALRIIIEDESCDIMENAKTLLQRLSEDHIKTVRRSKMASSSKTKRRPSKPVVIREVAHISENDFPASNTEDTGSPSSSSSQIVSNKSPTINQTESSSVSLTSRSIKPGTKESARILCDDVIQDAISSCHEPDYKMKLANLLSPEAKIELYIELGKLSNAQRLAFDINRRDYVAIVLREAERLNQDHIKDVCQHWLAKH